MLEVFYQYVQHYLFLHGLEQYYFSCWSITVLRISASCSV